MKPYWDTSGLVNAFNRGIKPEGQTRTHSVAEFFSTLSRTGITVVKDGVSRRLIFKPQDTATAARDVFKDLDFVDLDGPETLAAVDKAADEGVEGGQIYDWIHCRTADKGQAPYIFSLNIRHFERMTRLELKHPSA